MFFTMGCGKESSDKYHKMLQKGIKQAKKGDSTFRIRGALREHRRDAGATQIIGKRQLQLGLFAVRGTEKKRLSVDPKARK
jgi:hypothetical protein